MNTKTITDKVERKTGQARGPQEGRAQGQARRRRGARLDEEQGPTQVAKGQRKR